MNAYLFILYLFVCFFECASCIISLELKFDSVWLWIGSIGYQLKRMIHSIIKHLHLSCLALVSVQYWDLDTHAPCLAYCCEHMTVDLFSLDVCCCQVHCEHMVWVSVPCSCLVLCVLLAFDDVIFTSHVLLYCHVKCEHIACVMFVQCALMSNVMTPPLFYLIIISIAPPASPSLSS